MLNKTEKNGFIIHKIIAYIINRVYYMATLNVWFDSKLPVTMIQWWTDCFKNKIIHIVETLTVLSIHVPDKTLVN